MTEKVGSKTRVTSYSYDALNRLVEADGSGWGRSWTYTYDGAGNRLSLQASLPQNLTGPEQRSQQATFDAANQLTQLTESSEDTYPLPFLPASSSVETFAYDGNGNRTTSSGGDDYTYSASGRTTAVGGTEFTYRGSGQTERATLSAPCELPPCTTHFLDTALGLSGERAGSKHAVYVRDPWGTLLLQRSWTTEAALRRDAGATSSAYADHRFLLDGVGSVVGLADADAALVASFSYDPFGQLIESTGEADLTPYRFAGAYQDPTGLLKMGERYYDPSLGRFTQQDPIHDPLDPKLWNRYVYVGNDPVNFVDPTGLWGEGAWSKAKCIGGTVLRGLGSALRPSPISFTSLVGVGGVLIAFGAPIYASATTALAFVGGGGLLVVGSLLVAYAIRDAWMDCP